MTNKKLAQTVFPTLTIPEDQAAKVVDSYMVDGAFRLRVERGIEVKIELTGKGFSLSALQERPHLSYRLGWTLASFLDRPSQLEQNCSQKAEISYAEYGAERRAWVHQLMVRGYNPQNFEGAVPDCYEAPHSDLIRRLLMQVINPLTQREGLLTTLGLNKFTVEGVFLQGAPVVLQIFPQET